MMTKLSPKTTKKKKNKYNDPLHFAHFTILTLQSMNGAAVWGIQRQKNSTN